MSLYKNQKSSLYHEIDVLLIENLTYLLIIFVLPVKLNDSLEILLILSPAVQQVANYNDKYYVKKKQRPDHINRMRKTQVLRKVLRDVEVRIPTLAHY